MRAENEIVRNLFDDNLRPLFYRTDFYAGSGLAVRLNVGVYALLLFRILKIPIGLAHYIARVFGHA